MVITLTAKNPQQPKNRVIFNDSTQTFVPLRLVETMIDHLNIVSTVVPKSSEEGQLQLQFQENAKGNKEMNTIFHGKLTSF